MSAFVSQVFIKLNCSRYTGLRWRHNNAEELFKHNPTHCIVQVSFFIHICIRTDLTDSNKFFFLTENNFLFYCAKDGSRDFEIRVHFLINKTLIKRMLYFLRLAGALLFFRNIEGQKSLQDGGVIFSLMNAWMGGSFKKIESSNPIKCSVI